MGEHAVARVVLQIARRTHTADGAVLRHHLARRVVEVAACVIAQVEAVAYFGIRANCTAVLRMSR